MSFSLIYNCFSFGIFNRRLQIIEVKAKGDKQKSALKSSHFLFSLLLNLNLLQIFQNLLSPIFHCVLTQLHDLNCISYLDQYWKDLRKINAIVQLGFKTHLIISNETPTVDFAFLFSHNDRLSVCISACGSISILHKCGVVTIRHALPLLSSVFLHRFWEQQN